jgi:UDP-glucose 4-epimerase
MQDPYSDLEANCRAQIAVLETCRRHNAGVRIVFASTRQIYGRPAYLPVDEDHPLSPMDINGIHKLAGERYHMLYHEVYGMRACALRLTNTYGPRMRVKDARQTFVGCWIRLLLEGQPFELWDGRQRRDFTYVDDAVDALLRAASHEDVCGQAFNLGGAEGPVTLQDLADRMIRLNGGGTYVRREFPEDRKRIDIGDYYADDGRIRRTLGWRPRVRLDEGLARTLEYFRDKLPHYE